MGQPRACIGNSIMVLGNDRTAGRNGNGLGAGRNLEIGHPQVATCRLLLVAGEQRPPAGRTAARLLHRTADESFFGDGDGAKHVAQLLQEGDEVRVDFGENVGVADDLGEIAGPHLARSTGLAVGVESASGEEGGHRGVGPVPRSIGARVLLLATLFRFLESLRGVDNTGGDATEGAPDDGAGAKRAARVFAGQSDESIAAPFAARHGVRETEDVGDRIAGVRVAETERSGREAAREQLAAEGADGGAAQEGVVGGVRGPAKGQIGEDVSVARGIGRHRGGMEGIRQGRMGMRIARGVVDVRVMVGATGVDDLAGAQDGTAVPPLAIPLGGARGPRRQLLAHILRQGQATAGAGIAVGAAEGTRSGGIVQRVGLGSDEVGVVFDFGAGMAQVGGTVGGSCGGRILRMREVRWTVEGGRIMGRGRRIIGGEIGFVGVALGAGEREDLRADDRGGTMDLAEMRQRKLKGGKKVVSSKRSPTNEYPSHGDNLTRMMQV